MAGGLCCSFCRRSQRDARVLVAGPDVYMCDECVRLAIECVRLATGESGLPAQGVPTARIETVEEHVNGDWAIWSFNKSVDDAEATLKTLRRCNPDKRFRRATYVRLVTGEES